MGWFGGPARIFWVNPLGPAWSGRTQAFPLPRRPPSRADGTLLHRCVTVTAGRGLVLPPDLAAELDDSPHAGPPVAAAGDGA